MPTPHNPPSPPPPPPPPPSLYPAIDQSQPSDFPPSSSSSRCPPLDMKDLIENFFPESFSNAPPSAPPMEDSSFEETLLRVPGAIVHLVDKRQSIELASGDLTILSIRQGANIIAILARIGDTIQWPLAKDVATVKLDDSHYFFSFRAPASDGSDSGDEGSNDVSQNILNYGLTFASKGQEGLLKELDCILENYSSFSIHQVLTKSDMMDGLVPKGIAPAEMEEGSTKEMMEKQSAAYWTTLAPNVEDYSGCVARVIALGSGQLIKGILWCGDVTVERLKWGDEILKKRMAKSSKSVEVSEEALQRMKRVRQVTKMSQKVANGVLSGVVKVSGFFTSSVANSRVGKKFLGLLPGEIVLASLDGFGKVCDAVEIAGKNVLSTSSVVTTGLVSHRYGDQASEFTNQGLDAAGHALGTAWTVFKIRKVIDPKTAIKPTHLAKSAIKAAVADIKSKKAK